MWEINGNLRYCRKNNIGVSQGSPRGALLLFIKYIDEVMDTYNKTIKHNNEIIPTINVKKH